MFKNPRATSLFAKLRARIAELRTANSANVTVTFALATIPIVGFVGAAIDYSHANSVKTAMQAACDSTALMLSKTASTMTTAQISQKANDYFKALFTRTEATGVTVTATYTSGSGGSAIFVNASSTVKSNFMSLMGMSQMTVRVDSQVKWGQQRLRVALALDTTGSMQDDGKMTAMKAATKSLLDQLKGAASVNADVYVSIIPFSKDVNVGRSNYSANWIDWSDWDADNGDDVSSTVCTRNGRRTRCSTSSTWVPDNHNTWNGCVTDRGDDNNPNVGDYDTNVVAPSTSNTATLFTAEQYSSCSPQVMPLSYDFTTMKTLVDSFYPAGNTNQAIGLAHAWMSLVGGGPYPTPPAKDPNYQYQTIIILLTDGLNTEDRWYTNTSQIDAREAKTCANIKAAGITLYTVQVNTGGDPTSTLLKNCASSTDKFFLLTSSGQIAATFQQIGTALTKLRLAQ